MPLFLYLLLLVSPVLDFAEKPVRPFVNTFAGLGADHEYLGVRVAALYIFLALLDIKVEIGENINLVDDNNIAYGEHQRILERLVVALGHGENHRIFNGSRVELCGADEVADILEYCEFNIAEMCIRDRNIIEPDSNG